MNGLIIKDLYIFKQYSKQYLMMLGFFCIFAFGMKSPTYIVLMGITMGMTYIFSSLAQDELGGYEFALSLPVNRERIIGTKYLMLILVMGAVAIISGILSGIIALWYRISFWEWIPSMFGALGAFMMVMAILIPVSVKYKVEKARIIFLGIVLVPTVGAFLLAKFIGTDKINALLESGDLNKMILSGIGVFVAVAAICLVLSYFVSVRIFKGKEF